MKNWLKVPINILGYLRSRKPPFIAILVGFRFMYTFRKIQKSVSGLTKGIHIITERAWKQYTEMFAKYHYRMIPVVYGQDHLLGTIRHNDIMKAL